MLEGTLESFTLPDIFQLLAFTKKTGCLHLDSDGENGRVYFDDGQVYYAVSSTGRLALGRRLVGAATVDTDQLRAALDRQRELEDDGKGLRLGQILLEQGALDSDTLETFVREQIQDAVFDLMRWKDGSFTFDSESEDAAVDEPIELTVSCENLIMEGSRRLEEWENVKKKIPTLEAVVAMQPMPGEGDVEVNLRPEEWRLLTLVDGRRSVRELVDIFGQGEFQTCKLLYGMVGAGLLEVRDVDTDGPPSIAALLTQQELLRELENQTDSRPRAGRAGRAGYGGGARQATTPAAPAGGDDADEDDPEPEARPSDETAVADDAEAPDAEADEPDTDEDAAAVEPVDAATDTPEQQQRLTTDPAIDEDLVQRLIEGVKGL